MTTPDGTSVHPDSEQDPTASRSRGPHAERDTAVVVRPDGSGSHRLEESGLYELLVESVQDYAIFALDASGIIRSWNRGAQRIKGYTAAEIIGQHFSIFYPREEGVRDKTDLELEVAARDGRFEEEGWRLRKDGSRFWASVIITALRAPDGALLGFMKVTRDLTERRAAEERVLLDATRLAAAEAVSRTKSEFLSTLSHELRTPLNAIGGYAELIELGVAGPITDLQREYLERINSSRQHLLRLIGDLLDYSRIEAGRLTYATRDVTLHDLVDRVLSMVMPQATAKGLSLEHGPCTRSVVALADEARAEQILLSLLSNAVKFTPRSGKVTVQCTNAADRVAVVVGDTGPGIPDEQRTAIFEPFVQLGRNHRNTIEGTGLGLAISRMLARGMGGDLTVESAPGIGSTFTLALPKGQLIAVRPGTP